MMKNFSEKKIFPTILPVGRMINFPDKKRKAWNQFASLLRK